MSLLPLLVYSRYYRKKLLRDHDTRQVDKPIAEHLHLPHTDHGVEPYEILRRRRDTLVDELRILIQHVPGDLLDVRRVVEVGLHIHVKPAEAPARVITTSSRILHG